MSFLELMIVCSCFVVSKWLVRVILVLLVLSKVWFRVVCLKWVSVMVVVSLKVFGISMIDFLLLGLGMLRGVFLWLLVLVMVMVWLCACRSLFMVNLLVDVLVLLLFIMVLKLICG